MAGHGRCSRDRYEARTRGSSRTEGRGYSAGQAVAARACPPSSSHPRAAPASGRTGHPGRRRGVGAPPRRVLSDRRRDGPLCSDRAWTSESRGACGPGAIPVAWLDPGRLPRPCGALRGGLRGPTSGPCPPPAERSVHAGSPADHPARAESAPRLGVALTTACPNTPRLPLLGPVGGCEHRALPQQHQRDDEHQNHDREQAELQHGVEEDGAPAWASFANSAVTTRIRRVAAISPTMRKGSGTSACSRKETCTV
jgi:hypothetical protein